MEVQAAAQIRFRIWTGSRFAKAYYLLQSRLNIAGPDVLELRNLYKVGSEPITNCQILT